MHCLATARGAPPTAETKQLFVQGAGMRVLSQGDSALRPWLALPLWYLQLQTTLSLLLHFMRASCRLQIVIA